MNNHRDAKGRFLPGHHYSQGRSKGARNKLQADLLEALSEDFAKHGVAAVASARKKAPAAYLKICVAALPTDFTLTINPFEDMTDADLHERKRYLDTLYQEHLGRAGECDGGIVAAGEDGTPEPLPALPAPKRIP